MRSSDAEQVAIPFAQLENEDGTLIVRLGPGVMTIHRVRSYSGFEDFLQYANNFCQFLERKSESFCVDELTLTYVNHFDFPQESLDLERYFSVGFVVPTHDLLDGNPDSFVSDFSVYVDLALPQFEKTISIGLQSLSGSDIGLVFECHSDVQSIGAWSEAVEWLKEAHDLISDLFERSITEETKALLQGTQVEKIQGN